MMQKVVFVFRSRPLLQFSAKAANVQNQQGGGYSRRPLAQTWTDHCRQGPTCLCLHAQRQRSASNKHCWPVDKWCKSFKIKAWFIPSSFSRHKMRVVMKSDQKSRLCWGFVGEHVHGGKWPQNEDVDEILRGISQLLDHLDITTKVDWVLRISYLSVPSNIQLQVCYEEISILAHRCEACVSCWLIFKAI